jgi:acyl-CoA reductase-like NAD-dependent aldehyde dehydrogenase
VRTVPGFVSGKELFTSNLATIDDPYDGSPVLQVCVEDERGVDRAVSDAASAAALMRVLPTHRRAGILRNVAERIRQEAPNLCDLIVRCTGKTVRESRLEVERAPDIFELSAQAARHLPTICVPADAIPAGEGRFALLLREPVGVVAAVTPFNVPLNGLCHKLGPAFAAGNAIVAKADIRGSPIATMMARWLHEAGAPAGSLNVVHGDAAIGRALVAHPKVDFIALTGSTRAALEVQRVLGLRRAQFELGGNAATIIEGDASWRGAVPSLVRAAFGLSGQSCISLQRLLVHESIFEELVGAFLEATSRLKVGDPKASETDVGPVVSTFHAERICSWAREAIAEGAELLMGGTHREAMVQPTVLGRSKCSSRVMCEEVFGPLVNLIPYSDLTQAIEIVNSGGFGLQASILTPSLDVAMRAIRELKTGGVVVNGPSRQRLDHLPYGGRGKSGYGREGPAFAILEMTELKTVVLNP